MYLNRVLLYLLSINLSLQLSFKGPCPKIESSIKTPDYIKISALYEVPFDVFTPNYLLFPYENQEMVIAFHLPKADILLIELRNSYCPTVPGVRFNNQTQKPEVMLLSSKIGVNLEDEEAILCQVKLNFQMSMIVTEEIGLLWGCAEINVTAHDEALIVLAQVDFRKFSAPPFNSKGLHLLENKSRISEKDLKRCYWDEISGFDNNRNGHCSTLDCNYRYIHLIVFGMFVIIQIIIFITICRVNS